MGERLSYRAPALCAAVIAIVCTNLVLRADPVRNCPSLEDQSVIISTTGPTAFKLRVADLGDGTVNIFQFPLGGILQQPGPTPLDFIFVPMPDFGGTTTFTYRLTPPVGCDRGTQLGKVTLAGGVSDGTDSGLNAPRTGLFDLCGAGLPLLFTLTVLGMIVAGRRVQP